MADDSHQSALEVSQGAQLEVEFATALRLSVRPAIEWMGLTGC